jgi:hypothetical protein
MRSKIAWLITVWMIDEKWWMHEQNFINLSLFNVNNAAKLSLLHSLFQFNHIIINTVRIALLIIFCCQWKIQKIMIKMTLHTSKHP